MTINNNNNDWSVPSSRMDRLKAKEQQKGMCQVFLGTL